MTTSRVTAWFGLSILFVCLTACSGGGGGGGGSSAQAQTLTTAEGPFMTGVLFNQFEASNALGEVSVAGVSCPVGQTVISAGCDCGILPNSNGHDSGPVWSVQVVGNGAVCACDLGDDLLAEGDVTVSVSCGVAVLSTALTSATLGLAVEPESEAVPATPDAAMLKRMEELTAVLNSRVPTR